MARDDQSDSSRQQAARPLYRDAKGADITIDFDPTIDESGSGFAANDDRPKGTRAWASKDAPVG